MRTGDDALRKAKLRRATTAAVLFAVIGCTDPGILAHAATVRVVGASRTTGCAEEDNVHVALYGNAIAGLRIEATHPAYIHEMQIDETRPDFGSCDMRDDPVYHFEPRSLVLYEDAETRLVGHTFSSFWRPTRVSFTVEGRPAESGLHLVQLLRMHEGRTIEVLVLYPADGYWRPKPLPPAHLSDSAYGSSFLIGPVEASPEPRSRPLVELTAVHFRPADLTFSLVFARGGGAMVRIVEATPERLALDVGFEAPFDGERPFAALRSMFVSETVADTALASWQTSVDAPWQTAPILALGDVSAVAIGFVRHVPSSHNTSAPDLSFRRFHGTGRQP